ncbi:M48 family metallopeptidase [Cyanobacteria bacterium FACHB-472]|nr:M48 family metallopeptidase [Cyanobacteria bacterium FACHB-472]
MSSEIPSTATPINRNPPPSNRQLLIILGLVIGFIVGLIWLFGLLINSLVWVIPPSVEKQLGAVIVPTYEQLAKQSPTQDKLNQLLDKLETKLPQQVRQERDYRVLYLLGDTVNALALPGDRIIIYAGLLKQIESENELMMVLGHELGHFAHRDHLRSLVRQLIFPIAIATIFGDAGGLSSVAASGVEAVSKSQFSQSQESQADEFGLTLLQNTYGHVAGATDFFARMSRQKGVNFDFLTTHPAPGRRVKELQRLIEQKNYPVKERSPFPETLSNLKE